MKVLEDVDKGINLKLEVDEKEKINFLDIEIKRGKNNEKITTRWFRKKENAGIYCNWRSDVDESTKNNIVINLENKIGKFTTKEEDRICLRKSLWEHLKKNGYKRRINEKGRKN